MIDKSKSEPIKNFGAILKSTRNEKYIFFSLCLLVSLGSFLVAYTAVIDRKRGAYFIGQNMAGIGEYVQYNRPDFREVEIKDYLKRYTKAMYSFDQNTFEGNLNEALALGGVNGPAAVQVQFYKDNNYLEGLIGGNSKIQIKVDSIQVDSSSEPYKANVFSRQTTYSGAGSQQFNLFFYVELTNLDSRSEDNPYGLTLRLVSPFNQTEILK